MGKVEVEINGETYIMKGDATPEQMLRIATYVNQKIKTLTLMNSKLTPTQAAVLAAVNIADELNKLQEEYDNLIKLIDRGLQAPESS